MITFNDIIWEYIDNIKITNNINSIHCDTRDFYCLCIPKNLEQSIPEFLTKSNQDKKNLIKSSEIKSFLKDLETMSGGKKEWRFLSFKSISNHGDNWLKYIRLYRIEDDNFIITFNGEKVISKESLTQDNLDKEHL